MTSSDRRIAQWIDTLAIVAIVGLVLASLAAVSGCARFRAPTLAAAPTSVSRCEQLDDRAQLWGAIGGGTGALAGGAGLSTIASSDRTLRTSLAIGSIVMGALAAGASYLTRAATARYVEGGCGR